MVGESFNGYCLSYHWIDECPNRCNANLQACIDAENYLRSQQQDQAYKNARQLEESGILDDHPMMPHWSYFFDSGGAK